MKNISFIVIPALLILLTKNTSVAESWTVIEAVSQAMISNPSVEIAKSFPQEAKGERKSALSLPSPSIGLEYEGIPTNSGLSGYEERRLSLTQEMTFPLLYIWGISKENVAVEIANHQMRMVLLDLEANVRRVYTEAWLLSEYVKVMENYSALLDTHSSQTQRLYEMGEVSLLEARRSRVEALQAENKLENIRRERSTALIRLAKLIRVDHNALTLSSPLEDDRVDTYLRQFSKSNSDDSLPGNGYEVEPETTLSFASNPELGAADLNELLTDYDRKLALAGWMPEFELSYFRQSSSLEDNQEFWGAEIGFSIPLWFWWGGKGEIQATKARNRRANAEIAAMLIELGSDWEGWNQEFQTAYEQFNLYQDELVPLGQESFYLAQKSYSLGEIGYLEVIDAQRTYLDVQLENLEISSNLYISMAEMDRLSGHSIVSPSGEAK